MIKWLEKIFAFNSNGISLDEQIIKGENRKLKRVRDWTDWVNDFCKKNKNKMQYPKAMRAIEFFKAKPLSQYYVSSQLFQNFASECGINILSPNDITKENMKDWWEKTEKALPEGKTKFEDYTYMNTSLGGWHPII